MAHSAKPEKADHKLSLRELLKALATEGLVT
jgi:hypothetical protein